MKTASDPRHLHRIQAFKQIFSDSFLTQAVDNELAIGTIQHLEQINEIIKQSAPEWPLSQINRVDLSVMRLAIYELLYKQGVPIKVVLDEAVEIAKRYGSQSSSSFVNGALAAALKLTNRENNHGPK